MKDSPIKIARMISLQRFRIAVAGAVAIAVLGSIAGGVIESKPDSPVWGIAYASLGLIHLGALLPCARLARRETESIVIWSLVSAFFPFWGPLWLLGGPLLQSLVWSIALALCFGLWKVVFWGTMIGVASTVWIFPFPMMWISESRVGLSVATRHILMAPLMLCLGCKALLHTPWARRERNVCVRCEHSLAGLPPDARCPECGVDQRDFSAGA